MKVKCVRKGGGDGIDCRIENLHRNEFQGEYDYMMMEKPQAPSRERERPRKKKKIHIKDCQG